MNLVKAKQYNKAIWDHARITGCGYDRLKKWIIETYPELGKFPYMFGYCYLCRGVDDKTKVRCPECPLQKLWKKACYDESLYTKWYKFAGDKEIADQIYKDVKKS